MSSLSASIPLRAKNMINYDSMYDGRNYLVAVNYLVYDTKRKMIINKGTSKVCGKNHSKRSIHAEEMAIKFILNYMKRIGEKSRNRFKIIIWRYNKSKFIKPATCCASCTKLAKKYNFTNNMYTIDDNELRCSIIEEPKPSIGNVLRHSPKNTSWRTLI